LATDFVDGAISFQVVGCWASACEAVRQERKIASDIQPNWTARRDWHRSRKNEVFGM
jgi:hypothetical protein